MKIYFRSLLFFILLSTLYATDAFAIGKKNNLCLITDPPTVYSPVTYWQNCSKPLIAIPSSGGTLNWYTLQVGGVSLVGAPTPNTAAIGSSATYYVSQTVGGIESVRVPITVNVAVDNGGSILGLTCDASQIPNYSLNYTPPATVNNAVLFDWANNNAYLSQTYVCTYSIQGGAPITQFNPSNQSHYIVSNLLPGQSVELTLTSASHPCVLEKKMVCKVPCATNPTPAFLRIPLSYCLNDTPPVLPTTSTNTPAISGVWSPFPVDTSTMGTKTYTFTPDPILFPCAKTTTLDISTEPIEPNFVDFSICSGDIPASLSNTSPNGIVGTWNPMFVDNMNSAAYVFSPNPGQSCAPTDKTINVTVNPSNTIANISWTVTDAFAKNQIVTVTNPVGVNYFYLMDAGPFQSSPVFENVSSGVHSITIIDDNGCSEFTNHEILVINYPKYFTPNGDTYNDRWNIFGLKDQLNSRIYIFDRFGKLIKDISPLESGWDGTYIGKPMPADDYWFTVKYNENGVVKEFKSHFALKR